MGQMQAELLAQRLKTTPLEAIYSSPLRRALVTALTVALAQERDVIVEEDLTEIDHGAWNGLLKEEVEKRFGPLLQLWQIHPSQVQMPGGESLAQVNERAGAVLERILANHPQGIVALCSHDAVLKVIITSLLGLPLDHFWGIGLDNASVSILDLAPSAPCLLSLNDTCHLGKYRSHTEVQAL